MKKIIAIARKEIISFSTSISFPILSIILNTLAGWLFYQDLFVVSVADMAAYYSILTTLMIIFIPVITMGSLAEEKRGGNWEWLSSLPIKDHELIWGKYIGVLSNGLLSLAPMIGIVAVTAAIGQIDILKTIAGIVAVILVTACYSAIGLFSSAVGKTSIASVIIGTVIIGINYLIGQGMIITRLPATIGGFVSKISIVGIANSFYQGRLSIQDFSILLAVIICSVEGTYIWLKRRAE